MGQLPDGFSHPSSPSTNPLRNTISGNAGSVETVSFRGQPMGQPVNSGNDHTTNDLSGLEMDERQEGAKESTSKSYTFKPPLLDLSTLNDSFMSHTSFTNTAKSYKISL